MTTELLYSGRTVSRQWGFSISYQSQSYLSGMGKTCGTYRVMSTKNFKAGYTQIQLHDGSLHSVLCSYTVSQYVI